MNTVLNSYWILTKPYKVATINLIIWQTRNWDIRWLSDLSEVIQLVIGIYGILLNRESLGVSTTPLFQSKGNNYVWIVKNPKGYLTMVT